jgi:hypothetical protein
MEEIVTPHEAQIGSLLQIIAALLDKLGGEVVISRRDFEAVEDVPIVGRHLTKDYLAIRLADIGEETDISEIDLPEKPQI